MAFLVIPINAKDLPEDTMGDFSPLPDGEYQVRIAKCELKDTKDGTGNYLNFQLAVTEGKYAKRVIFAMVTLKNKSDKAEQIGHGQLRTIMEACGIPSLSDTDQLVGGNLVVRVGSREYNGTMQNEVKGYKAAGATVSLPAAKQEAPATSKASPPWAKK